MPEFTLTKQFRFEAAHQLKYHDGKCARRHGHSFVGRAIFGGDYIKLEGAKKGMLVDFSDVKKALEPLVETYLDHHDLNETLGTDSPTSEYIAHWIFTMLKRHNFGPGVTLVAVEIDETCTSTCRYQPLP